MFTPTVDSLTKALRLTATALSALQKRRAREAEKLATRQAYAAAEAAKAARIAARLGELLS